MSYINTDTNEYPVGEMQIKALYPRKTWPRPFVAPAPFARVFRTPQPEYDPITQGVRPAAPVLSDKGFWEEAWEVFDLDPSETAANLAAAITQARARAHARINAAYTSRTAALAAGYPEDEQKSWPVQVQEANAVLAGSEEPTPWIDAAATARGITREDLAALIQAQDTAYRQVHGALTGTRQQLRDSVDAVPDGPDAVATLDATNWPE